MGLRPASADENRWPPPQLLSRDREGALPVSSREFVLRKSPRATAVRSPNRPTFAQPAASGFFSGSCLYFGFRSLFGRITFDALTVPTRSRAIARTSFGASNFFAFFGTGYTRIIESAIDSAIDPVIFDAIWSTVTMS